MPTEVYAALLGTLVGALVTYWLGIKLAEKQHRHSLEALRFEACLVAETKLRAAFSAELALLRLEPEQASHIFTTNVTKHAAALQEFEHYVPAARRHEYRQLCEAYLRPNFVDKHLGRLEASDLENRVRGILSFAIDVIA